MVSGNYGYYPAPIIANGNQAHNNPTPVLPYPNTSYTPNNAPQSAPSRETMNYCMLMMLQTLANLYNRVNQQKPAPPNGPLVTYAGADSFF